MKVIIAVSRTIDKKYIKDIVSAIKDSKFDISTVISGTAKGVDTIGEYYAKALNIPVIRMPADWNKYGKSAGYLRNVEMAEIADAAILIWDCKSRGTMHMLNIMEERNKPVFLRKVELCL